MDDVLGHIQQLQFSDRAGAETLLLAFVREALGLEAVAVELRPLAVSLNSFNGFMTLADGQRLFFKTHTEPDNVIGEYYHAAALAQAGYPVLQPVYSSTEAGRQLLVYPVIDDPSVFDVAWIIEQGAGATLPVLTLAQQQTDDRLFEIYQATLSRQSASDAAAAAVHQLFYHRLTGGRLARFYGVPEDGSDAGIAVVLPGGSVSMRDTRRVCWTINGQEYAQTLDDCIEQATLLLNPAQAGPSVIGHGDAHNGNVFFQQRDGTASLMYFDPAFAGRHDPLLDLAKPLFHNVFAMWMYFPQVKRDQTRVLLRREGSRWQVEYDYALHPVREMFFESKVQRVLLPTLRLLKRHGWLRSDWRAMLKAALFCCPFLTMNLADAKKFPPEVSLLGLAMSVEMGLESGGQKSLLDRALDTVEQAL